MVTKYRNSRTTVDNIVFDSKVESERYLQLKHLKQVGKIKDFERQPEYILVKPYRKCPICGSTQHDKVCPVCDTRTYACRGIKYVGDFLVHENDDSMVVEDVKGSLKMITREFHMKMALYDQLYATPLRIVINGIRYRKASKGWEKA